MSDNDDTTPRPVRRREALAALGGLGIGGLLAGRAGGLLGAASSAEAASGCVLSPEVTEGPYGIDSTPTRRDIRENRPGLPLELVLRVQNARTCKAIRGADVELWHCDAGGLYSGFESASQGGPGTGSTTDAKRYLRGHQRTDARGDATFLTIFPGWYRGRTPHIHVKVHVGGDVVHTGQVFFDERTAAAVYRVAPYRAHGQPDTSHARDGIFKQAGGSRAIATLSRRSGGRRGYRGRLTMGVAT